MKKLIALVCLAASILSLVGCSGYGRYYSDDQVETLSSEFAQTVINAIADYDEQTFRSLFTDEALQSPHFEKGKSYLFEIFEGKIISRQYINTELAGIYDKHGKSYTPSTLYRIITTKNQYILYIDFYLDGYDFNTGKHYVNKIMRLRLAIESDLPEGYSFRFNGGMHSDQGIFHPDIYSEDLEP